MRRWDPTAERRDEVDLHPTRVFLHDTNGVPALVDLAAMRDALAGLGGDPQAVNPLIPAELVADHSVIADVFGRPDARDRNVELEYARNSERYRFLKMGPGRLGAALCAPQPPGFVQLTVHRPSVKRSPAPLAPCALHGRCSRSGENPGQGANRQHCDPDSADLFPNG